MRDPSRTALAAWALCLGVLSVGAPSVAVAQASEPAEAGPVGPASEAVAQFVAWVMATGDNHDLPFMIIDKVEAQVVVFGRDGQLRGAAPALLGLARGDDSVPGIGERKLSTIRPSERTTPAGRFLAGYGPGVGRRPVLWVDYDTAVSLHQVIVGNRNDRRLQRLQTPTPEDNRITYGCINVPAGFYENLVRPTFTGTSGIVYVLPEAKPVDEVFPSFRPQQQAAPEPAPSTMGAVENSTPGDPDEPAALWPDGA